VIVANNTTTTPQPPTAAQAELLEVLERLTREAGGLPPSLRELAAALNVHWTSAKERAAGCRARGLLEWSPRSPRTWRVTRPIG